MTTYQLLTAAIIAGLRDADPTCPNIYSRFRDPKDRNPKTIFEIFGETLTDGTKRMHAWHFDRTALLDGDTQAENGALMVQADKHVFRLEGFLSFVDDPETTSGWQELVSAVPPALYNSPAVQVLASQYNLVLTSASVEDIGFTFLTGENKCHWAQVSVEFTQTY